MHLLSVNCELAQPTIPVNLDGVPAAGLQGCGRLHAHSAVAQVEAEVKKVENDECRYESNSKRSASPPSTFVLLKKA